MARKHTHIAVEKVFVTRKLSKGVTTLTIAKVLQHDHQKIKRHVTTSQQRHKKRVQYTIIIISYRQSRYINRQFVKTQVALTRQNFKVCNMPKLSLATCCKVLQEIAAIQKSKVMSPLKQRHKSKRFEMGEKLQENASNVV